MLVELDDLFLIAKKVMQNVLRSIKESVPGSEKLERKEQREQKNRRQGRTKEVST